ncbi:Bardet-Biedl syndrome 2 protein [Borealophlyctis nickersoniae]|nr:Bardet-Biedl syndrome 2 protein [Borealophlyctis nickersoniae]
MADAAAALRMLVVRAEDSRLIGDWLAMKESYSIVYDMNRDLMAEHVKRTVNHTRLVESLKSVNAIIQKAANLRGK